MSECRRLCREAGGARGRGPPEGAHVGYALRAVEPYGPAWVEDPVFMDQMESLGQVQASARVPIATGETLGGLGQFKELLERRGCGVAIMDLSWCGGFSEARRIVALAEAWHITIVGYLRGRQMRIYTHPERVL